jgi:hypothetical protein
MPFYTSPRSCILDKKACIDKITSTNNNSRYELRILGFIGHHAHKKCTAILPRHISIMEIPSCSSPNDLHQRMNLLSLAERPLLSSNILMMPPFLTELPARSSTVGRSISSVSFQMMSKQDKLILIIESALLEVDGPPPFSREDTQ